MPKLARSAVALSLFLLCLVGTTVSASDPVHWGYDGDVGPEHWGALSPDFAACSAGKEQSPVDIPAAAPVNPPGLRIDYRPSELDIVNNGHSIQVNYEPGSTLEVGGAAYTLVQFHLHALSEHTLNGAYTDMELHLVHRDAGGHIAVVGVMIVEGTHNPAYVPILAHMPAEQGESLSVSGTTVDAGELLPAEQRYYRYNGSLTTPPCTEGVTWLVMAAPVELSAAQIAAFQALYDHNYRPVQPLGERSFLLGELPGTGGMGRAVGPAILVAVGLCLLAVARLPALARRARHDA